MAEHDFEDYSWIEERSKELDEKFQTYDPNVAIEFDLLWYAIYVLRVMPVKNKNEFLVPHGVHWNVVPGTEQNPYTVFGCPKYSLNDYCPVCDAIETAIAERRATKETFTSPDGQRTIMVQKRFLLRALLLEFEPGENKKKPPIFHNLPQLKIMKIPALIAKKIREKLEDERYFGPKAILSPTEGLPLKVEKNSKFNMKWDMDALREPYPIPEEFMNPDAWPDPLKFLPQTTHEEIYELIDKNKRSVHPIIANHVLALNVGTSPETKQLPPEKPKTSTKDLKAKLDAIKA